MNELPLGDLTIRERIMRVFKARFLSQQRGSQGAALSWDVVSRSPLSANEQTSGYAIGIFDTSEKKRDLVGAIECMLNVAFEFHVTLSEGDEPGSFANAVLGEVQRVAMLDLNNKEQDGYQLSVDVQEKGSELDIHSSAPSKIQGVLVVEVKYRHRPGKPGKRA